MEGKQILQDEDHLGIVNGKLTAGISYRDVAGIGGTVGAALRQL